ncbi:hypothetical protein HK102_005714, partial [Quaeritorhiza haematococci]
MALSYGPIPPDMQTMIADANAAATYANRGTSLNHEFYQHSTQQYYESNRTSLDYSTNPHNAAPVPQNITNSMTAPPPSAFTNTKSPAKAIYKFTRPRLRVDSSGGRTGTVIPPAMNPNAQVPVSTSVVTNIINSFDRLCTNNGFINSHQHQSNQQTTVLAQQHQPSTSGSHLGQAQPQTHLQIRGEQSGTISSDTGENAMQYVSSPMPAALSPVGHDCPQMSFMNNHIPIHTHVPTHNMSSNTKGSDNHVNRHMMHPHGNASVFSESSVGHVSITSSTSSSPRKRSG